MSKRPVRTTPPVLPSAVGQAWADPNSFQICHPSAFQPSTSFGKISNLAVYLWIPTATPKCSVLEFLYYRQESVPGVYAFFQLHFTFAEQHFKTTLDSTGRSSLCLFFWGRAKDLVLTRDRGPSLNPMTTPAPVISLCQRRSASVRGGAELVWRRTEDALIVSQPALSSSSVSDASGCYFGPLSLVFGPLATSPSHY